MPGLAAEADVRISLLVKSIDVAMLTTIEFDWRKY